MIGRWTWRPYEALARTMSLRYGVAPELILAIMGVESAFNPRAYRGEPQIGDASRGLMQLLLKTARGLGFSGPASALYDPETNADLGAKYLAQALVRQGYSMPDAISEYNGGNRPASDFGEVDPVTDKYRNQAYVDRVLQAWREFTAVLGGSAPGTPAPPGTGGGPSAPPSTAPPGSPIGFGVVLAIILGAIGLWRGARAA